MEKLFVIGDSISRYYGSFLSRMISSWLDYGRKDDNEVISDYPAIAGGGDSPAVLAYLNHRFSRDKDFHPDYLLLNCGLHDIKTDIHSGAKKVTLDQYKQNLGEIKQLIVSHGIPVIWVRTTPIIDERHNTSEASFYRYDQDVVAYNAAADDVFRDVAIGSIDLYGFTKSLGLADDQVYRDHAHFTEAVVQIQAAHIAGYLSAVTEAVFQKSVS